MTNFLQSSDLPRIIILGGPTGIGKTALAMKLTETFNGEILGADSLQIYQKLAIGTAKPTPEMMAQVPHHLVDFLDPTEPFDASRFKALADRAIADIISRDKIPVVVGGTGLYIRVLLRGIFPAPEVDKKLRETLNKEVKELGSKVLYARLEKVDPLWAKKINPNDKHRVLRGLEVFEQTGVPLSEHQKKHSFAKPHYDPFMICLTMDRKLLYQRIEARTEQMVREGFYEEYQSLMEEGYDPQLKPLLSLGYLQMGQYHRGEISLNKAIEDIKRQTKRYSKRQFTWFKKEPEVSWVTKNENGVVDIESLIGNITQFLNRHITGSVQN